MWRPPKTWQQPPPRPALVRKFDRVRMGTEPTGLQKRMAEHMRDDFQKKLGELPVCRECGVHHLAAAPPGHDLIVATNDDRLEVVMPSEAPKSKKKLFGLFK
jgi:hypothetical protein